MGKRREQHNLIKKFGGKNYAFAGANLVKSEAKHRAERLRSQGYNARIVKSTSRTTGAFIAHHPSPHKTISVDIYKVYVRKPRGKR